MPAKTKRISTLIESQLPSFISEEYELFSKFVEKYYESQEVQGGPLDIANNLSTYLDIDFYEKDILKQNDVLVGNISETDTSITLEDASSFPEKNGYVRINDEIIFYSSKVGNELQDCFRGVSGNTKLGDLYSSSNFQSTDASAHYSGATVYNVSNLFLYAFVKNFESQYLGSFPEKYLKGEVDKRTLIKNIQKFYKAKGTTSSIKFIFNTIVSREPNDSPEVYNPKDFTYKVSKSDWISAYAIKVKVLSGDPKSLVGQRIIQPETEEYGFISAVVDNVKESGNYDGEQIWDIILAPETVTGEFSVSTKTTLTKDLNQNDGIGKRVNVFSTVGWETTGSILVGSEVITFEEKNVTQFTIKKRGDITYNHSEGDSVYKPVILSSGNVELLSLGIVYNFDITDGQPHSFEGDQIQVSNPGFETSDPKIVNSGTNVSRWVLYNNQSVSIPTNTTLQQSVDDLSTDVSAIFADDQYYYITSSGFPSHDILTGSDVSETLLDQNILRIIRKNAIRTTEKYKTPKVDTGILLNGVRTYSYKDTESIRYGILESIDVDVRGSGYIKPPFVLLDGVPNKARAILSGSVVESYVVDTTEVFRRNPLVEVTSGRGAVIRAIVTGDEITSLVIDNPGEYYSSPPLVVISDSNGRGKFADYTAIVNTNGQITGFTQNATGKFYNQQTVKVDIIPVGSGATAKPVLTEWNYNRYEKLKNDLDTENGYLFQNYTSSLEYGYGYVANPKSLRISKNDNLNLGDTEPATKTHSPILGFAYDGNPIYGPFGYQNPLDDINVIRMTSSYSLNNTRSKGPLVSEYPLGTFVNDYTYIHKSGTLDENNGRFCVTPEYPEGTYAYFITIDENQEPQFPYLIGENYYSLPVSSNYDSPITQNEIPKRAKRFFSPGMPRNGEGVYAQIADVRSGTVDAITSVKSSDNFSVNSKVSFDNRGSFGNSAEALVESVKGKTVSYLDSFENKVVKLTTIQNAYLFTDDILRQPSSQASGTIVGNIENDNVIVLKDVVGTFDNTGTFSADIKTFFLLLDQKSSFTKGATVSLTDGINAAVATGEVLNGTSQQNTLEIKVLSGDWLEFNDPDFDYFLQSDDFFNTSGSRVVTLTSLSDNLEPFEVNQSVALVETTENHGLGIGDSVVIDIFPSDTEKTKKYFVRNRLYQEVTLKTPEFSTTIDDTGVGRFQILNGGADYTPGLYTDVPLTGGDGTGLTANITVSSAGIVSDVQIETKGSGYAKANYLSVEDDQLGRSLASQSTSRLTLYVDHVGYGKGSTRLIVSSSVGLVEGDLVKVGDEVLEISSISGKTLTVLPGRENTEQSDHYNNQPVSLYKASYNFPENYQVSNSSGSGYVKSYDQSTQKVLIVFDYNIGISNAQIININTSFFDASQPSRTVSVRSVEPVEYKFEFSEGDENGEDTADAVFVVNPIIEIQEYYRYIFDTYHPSMNGISFDVSPSKNYNIITEEKLVSTIAPGNPGSYTEVKFGFGPRIGTNQYRNKVGTDFTNFYYFDKNGIVDSDGQYLTIIQDPLQGQKTVNYVTPNRFVYDIDSPPLWDGSGSITYTTSGQFAVGEINSYKIINLGSDYKKTPIISGVYPNSNFIATATVVFDEETKLITGIDIDTVGSNYSIPKVIVIDGDGEDAEFEAVASDGKIFSLTVKNPGRNYTYAPIVNIIEGDVEAYVDSSTIGIPQSVSIIQNGGAFHLDKTISSDFTSKYTVSLTAPEQTFGEFVAGITPTIGTFAKGETVVQIVNGTEVLRARVSESRVGSNLLKIENVVGTIREDVRITGLVSSSTGIVKSVFVSTLKENITSSYDNIGYFKSDRGRLGSENQKLLDSFFYQDYSYVVKSKTPIDQWRDLIKSTTHPAGFRLFGQVDIETSSGTEMPVDTTKSSHFSIVQLWDPNKNKITVENTRRTVTQTIQKIENTRERKGLGSVSSTEFNFNESRAFTVYLTPDQLQPGFNGYDGAEGNRYVLPFAKDYQVGEDRQIYDIQVSGGQIVASVLDIPTNSGQYLEIPVRVAGNSNSDTVDLTFTNDPLQDLQNLDNWNDLYGNPEYSNYGIFRSDVRVQYLIDGVSAFVDDDTTHGKLERRTGSGIVPEYFDIELSGSFISGAFVYITITPTYGQTFTLFIDEKFGIEQAFKGTWRPGDVFRYYPVAANKENWIDFEVQDVKTVEKYLDNQTKVFSLYDENGSLFTPYSAKNLIITLDGVLQEPEVAYTVSGNQITFAKAPLGSNAKLTGNNESELTEYSGTTFYGRYFSFKDSQYNNKHFRKLRNIFQRSGRWLDAANQIERNIEFIVGESVGYGREIYPSLDWSTKLDDYQDNIRNILDAYQHDIRFGGNVKTADYSQIFVDDSDFSYLTTNKTESLDIFRYATNLARLAVRNWDLTLEVNYLQGSFKLSVESTKDLAVGMHISSGQAYPAGTKIVAIDSETQVELSNAALSNSGGGGGAPVGDTILDGDTDGDVIVPTSTLVIEPGTTYTVNEGDTIGVPSSFSGAATATFFFSRINSGRYYDASDLIEANREWIAAQSLCDAEVEEAFPTSYTYWYENPRDFWNPVLKYIDAVVYHLRYGGNKDVAEYSYTADFTPPSALLYAPYSLAESLVDSEDFILQHSTIVKTALSKATDYMIQAMRNTLSGRPPSDNNWSSFVPDAYQDPEVIVDTQIPVCADVASTLNTFRDILEETLEGNYTTEIVPANDTKTGYWTSLKPYVNYTLIPDPNLPYNGECDDVVSSIDSLYDNLEDTFNNVSYTRSLPDYVDGENKIFELYWEDGSEVFTEEDEDLFVTINAVLQRPKYNADYPGEDSYYIDRTTIPNKIVFDVAPIWDQDFGAKSIGEPTAVEKVIGIGVGNYKRLTIDKSLVDGTRVGPFLILDVEDNTVTNIEEKEYLYVFVDGILQREGYSYTVVGPNIYFNVPIKEEMNIDMRLLYGREVGQLLNLYDFEPDSYYAYGELALQATNTVLDQIESNVWRGDEAGKRIHCLQYNQDTTYNVIGELYNSYRTDGELTYRVKSQSSKFIEEQDIIFAIAGSYDTRITIPWSDFSSVSLLYEEDEVGRKITRTDNVWYGTSLRRSYRSPFVNLATGDQIKIDGQDKFRKIKTLPSTVTSKEGRRNEQITNNIFGTVSVESYAGITRGEGLSVVAIMETVDDGNGNEVLTGRIERLEWNQRSYEPITQPTAYQYYTPPILEFEPQNGDGGGARALVSVSKGQVVSVDLINPGSGYTKAPIVRVARNYTVLKDRDIGVSLINNSFEVSLSPFSLVVSYSLDVTLEGQGDLVTSSAFVQMPGEDETLNNLENRLITLFIEGREVDASDLILSRQITIIPPTSVDTVTIPQPTENSYAISVIEIERPVALSESIVTDIRNREFVSVINTVITNPLLSNVNQYEVGAYLDIDALLTDTILYIPDTTKFSSNGILLVGDEIVRYSRKLSDRFLDVKRAQKGTTAQFWPAGTFLRQIPDLVSVAFGGVAAIESESSVVSFDATTAKTEIVFTYEFGDNEDSIVTLAEPTKNSEAVKFLPGSGIYDRYVETIYMSEDILTRSGIITGVDVTVVEQRSNTVTVRNIEFGSDDYFVGNYEPFNAGPNIGNLDTVSWDSGESFVSGVSIEEYDLHYNSLTIQDFTDRKLSSYTISRDYVNLVNPSIQNPVQHVAGGTPIGSSVNVHSTHFFPSSGYFYHSDGTDYGIVYYGSKTSSSFEDCVNYRGNFAISPNSDIIPYTGSESSFVTPAYQEPVLDLNFSGAKSLNNQVTNTNPITFSRNSIGTYIDENGIIQTASINEPRFTYDSNGNSLGLLVEEERTNKLTSSNFSSGWTQQGAAISSTNNLAPDGTNTAVAIYGPDEPGTKALYKLSNQNGTGKNTFSFYAKATLPGTGQRTWIGYYAGGQENTFDPLINLDTGEITGSYRSTVGDATAGAIYHGNGWWRIWLTLTPTGVHNYKWSAGVEGNVGDILIWGAQLEEGSFPTSYLSTSGSTVTRQRDAVNILGTSFTALGFNGEQGTFYLEHKALEGTNNDGTNENTLLYNVGANGNLGTFYNTKSDTQDIFVFGDDYGPAIRIAQTQTIDRNKVAFSYDAPAASYGAYIDGVAQTNVTGTAPYQVSTYNQFNIAPFVGKPFSGTIGRLIYWSTRVDDNQVELITT